MLTDNALRYTLEHLLKVALPSPGAARLTHTRDGQRVRVTVNGQVCLTLALLSDEETGLLLRGKAVVQRLPSADSRAEIPLFRPAASALSQPALTHDGVLEIPYDLITPSFLLLSGAEERNGLPRDAHDRFRYEGSLAHRYGFIHLPLADEYAMLLRKWILENEPPDWAITPRQHRFIPTHDIDLLHRFQSPWQAFRSIAGRDLLIEHNLRAAVRSVREYRRWRADSRQDPYVTAILELLRGSEERRLSPVFFFKAQHSGEPGCTYDIRDPDAQHCIRTILKAGMRVGLHGSYGSYDNPELLAREKARLEEIAEVPVSHSRQHYLRRSAHPQPSGQSTLQVWSSSGITDDYTTGYAEQPGFRCGTCHPYPLYDTERDRATGITEHPLIVMDGSLIDYLHLTLSESNRLIDKLRQRCEAVEGDFILLWHNHLLSRSYQTAYNNIYIYQAGQTQPLNWQ